MYSILRGDANDYRIVAKSERAEGERMENP